MTRSAPKRNLPEIKTESGVSLLLLAVSSLATFCYPAFNVGNSSGLTPGALLVILVISVGVLVREARLTEKAFWFLFLPCLISAFSILLRGAYINERNLWVGLPMWAFSLSPLFLARMYVLHERRLLIAWGCSGAFLIHGIVGLYQYLFAGRLSAFYFRIFDNNSYALANFDTRPMGVFPEPSAMTATLGPLLLICYQLIEFPPPSGRPLRPFFVWFVRLGCLVGLSLAIVSQSGFAPTIVGTFGLYVLYRTAVIERRMFLSIVMALTGIAVGLASWWFIVERVTLEINKVSSWQTRWESIKAGIEVWTASPSDFLWGIGLNQLHLHMESFGLYSYYGVLFRFNNVFSAILIYLIETGSLGIIGLGGVLFMASRSVWQSGNRFGGALALLLWIAANTGATSYTTIPGQWFALGLILFWHGIFPFTREAGLRRAAKQPASR